MLIALGTTLVLGRSRDLNLPNLMTTLALTLGGAVAGGAGLGFLLHGEFGVASMGAVFGGGALAIATVPFFFGDDRRDAYDVLISACVLGLLTARVGCHFNGCDIGGQTDFFWGVVPHAPYHTSPAYEFKVHPFPWLIIVPAALAFVGVWLRARKPGHVAVGVALGYLVVRFFAEFFRAPSRWETAGLHLNQWLVLLAMVCVVFWARSILRRTESQP